MAESRWLKLYHYILAPSGVDPETVPVKKKHSQTEANNHDPIDSIDKEHKEYASENPSKTKLESDIESQKQLKVDHTLIGSRYSHDQLKEYYEIEYGLALQSFIRRLLSEYIGTFLLTFCHGALRLESAPEVAEISFGDNAVGVGLTLVLLIFSLGEVSGAHFNPTITLALSIRAGFPWAWLPFYWIIQFVGAITAGAIIRAFWTYEAYLATSGVNEKWSNIAGMFMEALCNFVLVFVVLSVSSRSRIIGNHAALAVGATLSLLTEFAGKVSSMSANPFRSLGPYIVNGASTSPIWPFVAGPFIGCIIASTLSALMNGLTPKEQVLTAAQGKVD